MLTVKSLPSTLVDVGESRRSKSETLIEAWCGQLGSDNTRDAYRRDVDTFVDWCRAKGRRPLRVRSADVDAYREECTNQGVKPATVARRLSALASFYDHALAADAIGANPVDGVDRPVVDRHATGVGLDDHESVALLDAAAELGPKAHVLVALLLVEGLKLAEVLALDIEQVDQSGPETEVTVRRRRGGSDIPLDARTAAAVRSCIDGRADGPVLVGEAPTQDGTTRLTRFGADFVLKRAARNAGLDRLSANTLRRTFVAASHRDGSTVDEIAGHVGSDARAVRRYLPTTD